MRQAIFILAVSFLLLTGCKSNTFQVVDARTGEPVEGVEATHQKYTTQQLIPGYRTIQTRYSDRGGWIDLQHDLYPKDHVELRHRLYQSATVSGDLEGRVVPLQPLE
ncbi:MAG: hypothetical protein AAGA29_05105 [Planctomycetota bacterium]